MIHFDENNHLFHLHNGRISCVLSLFRDEKGCDELLMPYYGAPLADPAAALQWIHRANGNSFDGDRQYLPYACPTDGRGDYRPTMVRTRDCTGQRCTELFVKSYRIEDGAQQLDGLPCTYAESPEEAQTLTITLADDLTGLEAEMSYTIYQNAPVLVSSLRCRNGGAETLVLEQAGSFCLTLPGRYDMIHLHGAWGRERSVERVAPATMTRLIDSARGSSGHEHNPFAVLAESDTTEFTGRCWGVNLIYSGDFAIAVDENPFDSTRLVAGLNPRTFEWRLEPGDSFQAPQAVCAYAENGLNAMSQAFHNLYRKRLHRGVWRDRERPILVNNWEATFFNFDHEKIMQIARTAADLGIEMCVLDDGWFGHRDADNCSLGDWVVDCRKLPEGLEKLAEEINALGLKFGLWFEPEMISPDSDLYRAHPDWCLHAAGRRRTEARQQLILDMSRSDVQDYIIDAVSTVLRSAPIAYVKWDMNRNFMEAGSDWLTDGREGEIAHRYILGVYRVMDVLTTTFPEILFEGCSGGGGRFDAGILHYMPQIWTSDNTNAVARLKIQYGTSFCYPPSAMGAHVTHSSYSVRMRGDVALGGNFGYELDLSVQKPEDLEEMRRQIVRCKAIRHTTQQGTFTRLISPFEGNLTAWQFADETRVIVCVYRLIAPCNQVTEHIRLHDVPKGVYRTEDGQTVTSDTLEQVGILPHFPWGDFASDVIILERVENDTVKQ